MTGVFLNDGVNPLATTCECVCHRSLTVRDVKLSSDNRQPLLFFTNHHGRCTASRWVNETLPPLLRCCRDLYVICISGENDEVRSDDALVVPGVSGFMTVVRVTDCTPQLCQLALLSPSPSSGSTCWLHFLSSTRKQLRLFAVNLPTRYICCNILLVYVPWRFFQQHA